MIEDVPLMLVYIAGVAYSDGRDAYTDVYSGARDQSINRYFDYPLVTP